MLYFHLVLNIACYMTLSWLKINKMALPVEDVKVDHVAKVGNMTKGFLPHCCPGDFPEEPEKAVEKLHPFLGLWYKEKIEKAWGKKGSWDCKQEAIGPGKGHNFGKIAELQAMAAEKEKEYKEW